MVRNIEGQGNTGTAPLVTSPPEAVAGRIVHPTRAVRWLERAESLAPTILALLVVLWIAGVFVGAVYKYEMYGQGYDQVDFEQAIWNTVHGHVMADSRFNFTDSIFGMDWMPMLLFFVPFYAVIQSPNTLFLMQIVGASLGAIPLYWLARDRLGSKLAGLGFGLAYLLYPTLLYGVLNPFQVRLFATTLLLFGFYFFEKERRTGLMWFASCALLAMLARTDVSLVVAMFGVYGLLSRRRWPWVVPPLVVGFGYFALSTFLIVPSFLHPDALRGPTGAIKDYMACWPCGHNPVLAYYGHLGGTFPEIARYIVTHPVDLAKLMFSGPKVEYMLSMLLPLAFLPLLSWRPLVLGLPILVLNLLSERSSQFSYQTHYSLLMIPGLFAAAIYGTDNLARWLNRRRQKAGISKQTEGGGRADFAWRNPYLLVPIALVAWGLVMQVPFKNPWVRAFLYHESPAKVAAARDLVKMVPPDAKVAASSFLAPHLLPRRYIYNFPPAPYSPYNFGADHRSDRFVELDYIFVDPDARALEVNPIGGKTALEHLRAMPDWVQVGSEDNLFLFRHK